MMAGDAFGGYPNYGGTTETFHNGGGFLNGGDDSMTSGHNAFGDNNNNYSGAVRRWNESGVRPVTICQLNHSSIIDGSDGKQTLLFEGYQIHAFTLVARVLRKDQQATSTSFQLTDGTGTMSLRIFSNGNEDEKTLQERDACEHGKYVRIVCTCTPRDGRKTFVGRSIKCIEDSNEITHHQLEAMYAHCYSTKGPLKGVSSAKNEGLANQANTSAPAPVVAGFGGMNTTQQKIAQVISKYSEASGAHGVSISTIISGLYGISDENTIREECRNMIQEGFIYETTENDTFLLAV